MQVIAPMGPKQKYRAEIVKHAPKLPQGMLPSACHTIGGTGAVKELRRGLAQTLERKLSVCPESTLLSRFISTSIPWAQGRNQKTQQPVPRGGDIIVRREGGQCHAKQSFGRDGRAQGGGELF